MPNLPYYKKTVDQTGKRVFKWKLHTVKCPSCGKEFTTRNPTKVYCTRTCMKDRTMPYKPRVRKYSMECGCGNHDRLQFTFCDRTETTPNGIKCLKCGTEQ